MKTEVNCFFSVWHQWLTGALWELIHSNYHSSQAISVNITFKRILDVKQGFPGRSIYDRMWSAAKWAKHFLQQRLTTAVMFLKDFSFSPNSSVCLFLSLSLSCWFSEKEQTQEYYTLSLGGVALTTGAGGSKWEADDTDPHKMETPLSRQTLHCDNCYLITARKARPWFSFFSYCVNTLGRQIFQWLPSLHFNPYGVFCLSPQMLHSQDEFSPNRRNYSSTSSGSLAPCYTMNTQRSHTISHRGQCQSFIKLPSYLIFCHCTDMRVIFFIYVADFQGIMH